MSTVNDMLTFLAVAESGSFTAAENILSTPKSNISRKITRLEKALNVRLFERTTRAINLTEAGRIYLEHCRRVKEEIDSAEHSLEALSTTPSGHLKVCTSVNVGQVLLAPVFIEFLQRFPKINMDIQLTNRRVDLVEEGVDVAFRVGTLADSNLISKRLCSLSLHLYASVDYIKQHDVIEHPEQLLGHTCLYMSSRSGNPSWPLFNKDTTKTINKHKTLIKEIKINPHLSCDDFSLIYKAMTAGSGVALLPDYMCEEALKEGKVMKVLENEVGRVVDFHAIYPSRRGKLPKLNALLEFLEQKLNLTN